MADLLLKFEQDLRVTPELVLRAFTNASMLRRWLCDLVATAEPRPGGRLYLSWASGFYACGEYTLIEPAHRAAFTWFGRGEPGLSSVTVTVTGASQPGGTHLTLEHLLPEDGPAWQKTYHQATSGWRESLVNLVSVLENGLDLNFVNRPMLGVVFSDYNAEIARELGVPSAEGVRLDDVIEGMAAHGAGLQMGDVLVELGGKPMRAVTDFQAAISGKRAGDTLPVVYFRGPERRTSTMMLSRRQLPEIPWSPQELASEVRRRFDDLEAEIDRFFAGVGDALADFRPAPDAWTIKEILAHLIQNERFKHQLIDETVGGFESWSDGWGGNLRARVRATVAAYPTLQELLGEVRRGFAETVAFYANLPAEFVSNNKAGYWSLAYGEMEAPYHFHVHLQQITETLEAARRAATSPLHD